MLKPARQSLEQEFHLCDKIGKDVEILESRVDCEFVKNSCECKKGGMCVVYMAMSRARHHDYVPEHSAQSQPKFTPDDLDRLGCPPISTSIFTHPYKKDDGFVHPYKKD